MRIDDANRAAQSQQSGKADAVRPSGGQAKGKAGEAAGGDEAQISNLASALSASGGDAQDARLERLRMEVENGTYSVSAQDVAGSIIDRHIRG